MAAHEHRIVFTDSVTRDSLRVMAGLWYLRLTTMDRWAQFNEMFGKPDRRRPQPKFGQGKNRGPKWGQRGRHRLRRARIEGRKGTR